MKQFDKQGARNKTGAIGEKIAKKYLQDRNFKVISENYLKKWGEIDIVARETGKNSENIRFVEVKTVSYETKEVLMRVVSHGTYRPEENVHRKKLERLYRTIESWISENGYTGNWQIDVIAVRIVPREKYSSVKHIENVIFE